MILKAVQPVLHPYALTAQPLNLSLCLARYKLIVNGQYRIVPDKLQALQQWPSMQITAAKHSTVPCAV